MSGYLSKWYARGTCGGVPLARARLAVGSELCQRVEGARGPDRQAKESALEQGEGYDLAGWAFDPLTERLQDEVWDADPSGRLVVRPRLDQLPPAERPAIRPPARVEGQHGGDRLGGIRRLQGLLAFGVNPRAKPRPPPRRRSQAIRQALTTYNMRRILAQVQASEIWLSSSKRITSSG